MEVTSYLNLKKETLVIEKEDGITVFIPSSWVIEGEERVSYTTIIRLIECCREYHWIKDIQSLDRNLDSICGTINAKFVKTIEINSTVNITYLVKSVLEKKYILEFIITDENGAICSSIDMISFFYNPVKHSSTKIPDDIILLLKNKEYTYE